MTTPAKVIVQFRKQGKRVTTKTVSGEAGCLSDFEAVMEAESILQNLVDNRQIPATLLDYDTVRLNNVRDIAVSGTGRHKAAMSMLDETRATLAEAQAFLKR